jgi:hypothetical protein
MLLLSARAGALAQRIGPRLPMTIGLVIASIGMVLLSRIGAGASYWAEVVPSVTVFALGLSGVVAPLTATVLASADVRHAGVAAMSCSWAAPSPRNSGCSNPATANTSDPISRHKP